MISLKKLLSIGSLLLYASAVLAQSNYDVKVEPRPYDLSACQGKTSNKSLKSRAYFISDNVGNRYGTDTVFVEYYDTIGNKTKVRQFTGGKQTGEAIYEYPKQGLKIWRSGDKNKTLTISKSTYDSKDRLLHFENFTVVKKDTTSESGAKNTYNSAGLLIKTENLLNNKVYMIKSYDYVSNNMVKATTRILTNPDYYNAIGYRYNSNHQVVQKTEYYYRKNITDSLPPHTYTYDKKNLIAERYMDSSNPKKFIDATYTYDQKDRIKNVTAKEDTIYRSTDFEYTGANVSKVTVKANDWLKLSREFYINSASPLTKMPMVDETVFVYDKNGYLIRKEESLNGRLMSTKSYALEYY